MTVSSFDETSEFPVLLSNPNPAPPNQIRTRQSVQQLYPFCIGFQYASVKTYGFELRVKVFVEKSAP